MLASLQARFLPSVVIRAAEEASEQSGQRQHRISGVRTAVAGCNIGSPGWLACPGFAPRDWSPGRYRVAPATDGHGHLRSAAWRHCRRKAYRRYQRVPRACHMRRSGRTERDLVAQIGPPSAELTGRLRERGGTVSRPWSRLCRRRRHFTNELSPCDRSSLCAPVGPRVGGSVTKVR